MSLPLHMLRLPVNERRLFSFAATQRLSQKTETDDGYLLHAALAALFGADAPRPFAMDSRKNGVSRNLLAYSPHTAEALRQTASLNATPDAYQIIDWAEAADKPMPATFGKDQKLDFSVRVLPVARAGRKHPAFKPGAEVDVFLLKAEADRSAPKPDREEIYHDWLARQMLGGGAELLRSDIAARRRTGLLRRDAEKALRSLSQHPDLDVTGTLIVRDPALFRSYVARGVGRHRAFGFGMLLLKASTERPAHI